MAWLAFVLSGCGGAYPTATIDRVEYQWADEPDDAAWKPAEPAAEIGSDPLHRPIWFRVAVPAIAAPDPAVRLGLGLFIDQAWVDGRRVEPMGTLLVIPVPAAPSVLILRARPPSVANVPTFRTGSQRGLWAMALRRELPEFAVAGALLLTGLLLIAATLRRGSARAYRGLGIFLGCLGILTLLQLPLLRIILLRSPYLVFYVHEVAGYVYPIGFADFTLAVFGDGKRRLIARGLGLYVLYAVIIWILHVTHVLGVNTNRVVANGYMLVLSGQALALAAVRARAGDGAAKSFIAGFGTLLLVSMPDLLGGMGLLALDFQTAPYGMLAFGVAMTVVTERRLAETRDALASSAGELSRKIEALEERNREVGTLNAELRHQIAERSKQMADALQAGLAPQSLARQLRGGEVVDGRYRILRELGHGGMGVVHEVERVSDGRRFALKVMARHASAAEAARFAREAEIAARLADAHLVAVVDVGAASGLLYLVMELVIGNRLDEERSRFGDVAWGAPVLAQIASGLAVLHEAGVVHRDLKPGNVLLARADDGSHVAKISDFGISRFGSAEADEAGDDAPAEARAEAATIANLPENTAKGVIGLDPTLPAPAASATAPTIATADVSTAPTEMPRGDPEAPSAAPARTNQPVSRALTQTGVLMGTPAYMAPELAFGARGAKPASDIFAFGLIAYEVLCGRPAFSSPAVHLALVGSPLPAIDALPPAVPAAVAALVLRCLDASPDRRPSAEEAAATFAGLRASPARSA